MHNEFIPDCRGNDWSPNGSAFFWMPKEGIRRIEENLELGDAASAKLVYLALCRIACNERSAAFTKPINYIATLSSLHRRTVERRLPSLEKLGLLTIARRKIDGTKAQDMSTYNLATLGRKVAAAKSPHAVAVNREQENKRTGFQRPLTVPDRIAAENSLKILKSQLAELEGETSEQWQRDDRPDLVVKKQKLRAEIIARENALLR